MAAIDPTPSPAHAAGSTRWLNVVLGVWLFISAFLWPHTTAQLTNTWILGVLCVVFALAAMAASQARYLNALLAVWLFISAWALPSEHAGTIWNNVLVAIAIFAVAMIPSGPAAPLFHRHGPRAT